MGIARKDRRLQSGGIRFDWQRPNQRRSERIAAHECSCAETGEVLVSIRDAYAYGRNGLQLEGTSSTNQLDWLVCLAISFGLRKAWQCFCTFQLSIR